MRSWRLPAIRLSRLPARALPERELCYAQIGGLTVATFLTLLLVPVIYTIFVCDLRWIRWEEVSAPAPAAPAEEPQKLAAGA